MVCCQGDGGHPDRRAWGQPSSWPPSALTLAPGHDLDTAGHVGTAHQQALPFPKDMQTLARASSPGWEGAGVNCRPRKSPLHWTRGSPNVMNNNAQAAVGHGCSQAREGRGGPRWVVKTPRQRLSAEPPGAAPAGGRAGGAHSGLCVRRAGLCAPASPFLAQCGRLTESPPGSSQAARAGDSQPPVTRPASRTHAQLLRHHHSLLGYGHAQLLVESSNAGPAPLAGGWPSAGPSWQRGWGSEPAFRRQRFPCDFPGANRYIRPQLLRPCT